MEIEGDFMSFSNEFVVFTGTLNRMTRDQAKSLIYSLSGHCQNAVSKKTTILVVGYSPIELFEQDSLSKKRLEVNHFISLGYSIVILTENDFLKRANNQLVKMIGSIS